MSEKIEEYESERSSEWNSWKWVFILIGVFHVNMFRTSGILLCYQQA
jgi:hypothetical protein